MHDLITEFGHSTYTAFPVIAARLLMAAIFGAVIGFEREWRKRPAGLRTHMLVCLAASAFGVIGIEIVHSPLFMHNIAEQSVRLDPIRLIEAVTAGVAFLAAGVVIVARGEVHGLTTGAGMWLAGAVGLASGLGFWQIALFVTLLALVVLGLMRRLEARLDLKDRE